MEKISRDLLTGFMRQASNLGLRNILVCGSVPPLSEEIFRLTDLFEIHLNYRNRIRRSAGSIGPVIRHSSKAVLRVFITERNVARLEEDIYNCLDKIDPENRLPVRVSVYPPSGRI